MPTFVARVKNSPILKNLTILVSGAALAQLVGILAAPLLSRLYSPEDFGVVGLILAVVGVLSVISSLKYEMALVLEKNDENAAAIQKLCWRLLLSTTTLFGIVILTTPLWLGKWIHDEGLSIYLPWSIPLIFLTGYFNILSFKKNRDGRYKTLSLAGVGRRSGLVLTQIIFGFCGAQVLGLVLGNLIGCMLAVAILLLTDRKQSPVQLKNTTSIPEQARKYRRFAIYSAPQNLLNALSQNIAVYILGYFFGVEVVGAYWLAMRLLQLPSNLIVQSVRQVLYKRFSETRDEIEEVRRLYKKSVLTMSMLMIPVVLLMFLYGPELFGFVLGEEWTLAGEYSSWMVLWIAAGFVNPAAVCLFTVYSKQRHFAVYDFILLLFRATSLFIGGIYFSSLEAIALYSLVGFVFNLYIVVYWFYALSKNDEHSLVEI
ncbi:hypothetical protein Rhal01_01384 [Rubritalea halochordaticola]|uniref:Lipopolysaccharide biosynthesis protein n=1 Tax=Rubritalea halochordaticola TaxID=714537 RepID=A0ABP9UXN2_9BACT